MIEVQLDPSVGLKQSVDYAFTVVYPADRTIQSTDTARMELRYALDDPLPLETLSTANGRLSLNVAPDGEARLYVQLTGEASAAYAFRRSDGTSRYRKLKPAETPGLAESGSYFVLPLFGTLIVTSLTGQDRLGSALDFRLLFEASYTRGVP